MQSEAPPSGRGDAAERARRRLERLLPELIKRFLENGLEKIAEGPENVRNLLSELKLPKEVLMVVLAQLDETKTGLYRVAAKEIRDFLEHTNFADEIARVLTTLSFEVKTEVRFIPNDSRLGATPDIRARVRVKRNEPDKDKGAPPTPRSPAGEEPT
ncbi:MAG TPA: hypothetical protein VH142_11700 [Polyangiaceae bacterium]|nr:hypothetical protein [Polyangiaceae bacterium]